MRASSLAPRSRVLEVMTLAQRLLRDLNRNLALQYGGALVFLIGEISAKSPQQMFCSICRAGPFVCASVPQSICTPAADTGRKRRATDYRRGSRRASRALRVPIEAAKAAT